MRRRDLKRSLGRVWGVALDKEGPSSLRRSADPTHPPRCHTSKLFLEVVAGNHRSGYTVW